MEQIINSYNQSKNLHHAYFLVGEKQNIVQDLTEFLEKNVGIKVSGNPDFRLISCNSLTIDEARHIGESSERMSFSGEKKVFVIETDFISEEAQNSLLKVFEEPTLGTHFFIISPQDILLPTLRSRMQVILIGEQAEVTDSVLSLSFSERLLKVKEITEGISDEQNTKQDAVAFLNQIEKELYEKGVEKNHKSLIVCEQARQALYDRGAPVKIILENVLLSV